VEAEEVVVSVEKLGELGLVVCAPLRENVVFRAA
jgi:hypothetical protein